MLNLNSERFTSVVQTAFDTATERGGRDAKRWTVAIVKAQSILRDTAFWHMTERGELLVLSPDSDIIYETNGRVCEQIIGERRVNCPAYDRGMPCKHRAMHRLLKNYLSE